MESSNIAGEYQFPTEVLRKSMRQQLPAGYVVSPLSKNDYANGYLELLSQLSTVGNLSKEKYEGIFDELRRHNEVKRLIVVKKSDTGKVVGAGSLIFDRKFIHEGGIAGHIEDIVVCKTERGKNLGKLVVQTLMDLAEFHGAYKVLLACTEYNKPFYEKCGLVPKELSLAKYFK